MLEKNNNLMSGKGEWDEAEHPRDSDGKFTSKGGGQSTMGQAKDEGQSTKKDQQASSAGEQTSKVPISKERLKQLVGDILNFEPITLKIGDRTITAKFDKYSAQKNIYTRGTSTHEGYLFKLDNVHNLPSYIESSKYAYTKQETGKMSRQHQGVKEWHYFINKIQTSEGVFDITVNVRDKGNNQFIYEVAFRKNKKT